MRNFKRFLAGFLILSASTCFAQDLGIGSIVPDFEIPKIINSASRTAKISDFKSQLLIVDFWEPSCAGCVIALPKMESLQKNFGDKIKILPVSAMPGIFITKFWKQNSITKNLTLPSVVEDLAFSKYFKHKFIPHEIWIYKGKVVAITSGEFVNKTNIQKILDIGTIDLPLKNDFFVYDGSQHPIFEIDSQYKSNKKGVRYTALGGYNFGGGWSNNRVIKDTVSKTLRSYYFNASIFTFYLDNWLIYNNGFPVTTDIISSRNFVKWEVADPNRYFYEKQNTEWMIKNAICFETQYNDTGQTAKEIAIDNITKMNSLLGLDVRWEKQKEKVLLLKRVDSLDRFKAKSREYARDVAGYLIEPVFSTKGSLYVMKGDYLKKIVEMMLKEKGNPYVIDETGYSGKIDMELNIPSWKDIPAIRKALKPYGLELREEDRVVERFVFNEVNGGLMVDVELQNMAKLKRAELTNLPNPTKKQTNDFINLNAKRKDVITLPSGLQYRTIKKGNGIKPKQSDKVLVNYEGTLINGKIFDSSYENGRPSIIKLQDVIPGWREAFKMSAVGGVMEIIVPSELAYGVHTLQGKIPPNSTLVFKIELLGIAK